MHDGGKNTSNFRHKNTLNDLNPQFIKDIFQQTTLLSHKQSDIKVHSHNTIIFADKSLTTLFPGIWNSLPEEAKTETVFPNFKNYIKQWT